jgi:nitroimidazol reductase NimA-like FMN-containing flavoprotein (pyridoxamine 5'-phosphate oxidase superfamily)
MTASEAWLEELSLDECLRLLRSSVAGRIAVVIDDFPVVVPVNFRLAETERATWIAVRTRPGGLVERGSVQAAFEIDGIDPGSRQGWSVLARGTLHHVDPDVADFRARFDPEPWILAERDTWMVIEPFAITGRRLHAAEIEWAFDARAYL